MPKDIKFKKKEVAPNCNVYAIKLVGTAFLERVDANESITFTRVGQDLDQGFTVSIDGVDAPEDDIVVDNGQSSPPITAPDPAQDLEWKYSISFHNDGSNGETVVDLDPIIIINKGGISSLSLKYVGIFAAGAAVAYTAVRFFPGLLGMG